MTGRTASTETKKAARNASALSPNTAKQAATSGTAGTAENTARLRTPRALGGAAALREVIQPRTCERALEGVDDDVEGAPLGDGGQLARGAVDALLAVDGQDQPDLRGERLERASGAGGADERLARVEQ